MSYFFFLYRLPSLSFSTVSDSISSNIDEVLSINPSTNVFVFGEDFNIHHKDWLTYSGGTDQSWKIYYNFSNDLTLMVNFPARDWFSQSCSFGFIFSDASICSTECPISSHNWWIFPGRMGQFSWSFRQRKVDFLLCIRLGKRRCGKRSIFVKNKDA